MTGEIQSRVRARIERMDSLCALRRELTEEEADELMRLKDRENRRRAHQRWLNTKADRAALARYSRQWRASRNAA
jgi:hypothetical protein